MKRIKRKVKQPTEEEEMFDLTIWCLQDKAYKNVWSCKQGQRLMRNNCSPKCKQAIKDGNVFKIKVRRLVRGEDPIRGGVRKIILGLHNRKYRDEYLEKEIDEDLLLLQTLCERHNVGIPETLIRVEEVLRKLPNSAFNQALEWDIFKHEELLFAEKQRIQLTKTKRLRRRG